MDAAVELRLRWRGFHQGEESAGGLDLGLSTRPRDKFEPWFQCQSLFF